MVLGDFRHRATLFFSCKGRNIKRHREELCTKERVNVTAKENLLLGCSGHVDEGVSEGGLSYSDLLLDNANLLEWLRNPDL